MSELFMDIWTFVVSQVGLLAIGFLGGTLWGAKIKNEIADLIDGIKE